MGLFDKFKKETAFKVGLAFLCIHGKVDYICHKNNGDYEVFCENCYKKLDLNSIRVTSQDYIREHLDSNLLNVEKGKYIINENGDWYENDITLDEYTKWVNNIEEQIVNENIKRNKELRCDFTGIIIKR